MVPLLELLSAQGVDVLNAAPLETDLTAPEYVAVIERRRREHMHFVDDVDLGARNCRAELHALDDLARVFDACMRCSVHFRAP